MPTITNARQSHLQLLAALTHTSGVLQRKASCSNRPIFSSTAPLCQAELAYNAGANSGATYSQQANCTAVGQLASPSAKLALEKLPKPRFSSWRHADRSTPLVQQHQAVLLIAVSTICQQLLAGSTAPSAWGSRLHSRLLTSAAQQHKNMEQTRNRGPQALPYL